VSSPEPFDHIDALGAGDDRGASQTDEQPVLHHPRDRRQFRGENVRPRNALKRGIEDEVAAVRDERMAVRAAPQLRGPGRVRGGSRRFDRAAGRGETERHHLDRQGKVAEQRDPFGVIGNHEHAGGGRGDDLLTQQRAPTPFDQTQVGRDLVSAVDGEIEFRRVVEGGQRNGKALGVRAGCLRSGHPDDVEPGAHALGEKLDEVRGGRAGAEAQAHAVVHKIERPRGSLAFVVICVHGRGGWKSGVQPYPRCARPPRGRDLRSTALPAHGRTPRRAARVAFRRKTGYHRTDPAARLKLPAMSHTIVFDLDGTLVDTAPDLVATLNAVLAREGYGSVAYDDARTMIGGGARHMLARALSRQGGPAKAAEIDRLFADFIPYYAAHIADHSRPFPGLEPALDLMAGEGARFAVCTNKLEHLSVLLLERLGLAARFSAVCGQDTFGVAKPDPELLRQTIARAGGDVGSAVMVGDSAADVTLARAAGVPVIAVDFGYSDVPAPLLKADRVIGHFDELPGAVAALLSR
jgi:phosphoglycolate phosphatase